MAQRSISTKDGGTFTALACDTMEVHHAADGSAIGLTVFSSGGEERHMVFDQRLIDLLPEVFQKILEESRRLRA